MKDGKRGADEVRREASAWIARMRGPGADRSRLDFERWRAADPLHRGVYSEMEQISRGTRQLGASSLGHDYQGLRAKRPLLARPGPRLAVASVAAMLVAGSGLLFLRRAAPPQPSVAVASDGGQLRHLRLSDGTNVTLDAGSRIELAFSNSARLVRLVQGRARFDVAPRGGAPFMVEAGDRLILDRGTIFDVGLGRGGVKVALLRGAVEIHERSGSDGVGLTLARLLPGQTATAPAGYRQALIAPAVTGEDRWVDGLLSYDGARLADVVADLDRYATPKLRLGDPALADLRVTGVFRAVPTESAARAVAAALSLRITSDPNGDLILLR